MTDTRPVWLTREQRDLLSECVWPPTPGNPLAQIVAAWDAAPADPISVHAQMMYRNNTQSALTWNELKEWQRESWREDSADYLRVLGLNRVVRDD